jgi:hypothetical protein
MVKAPALPQANNSPRPCALEELIEPRPLPLRISPALVELGLRRVISWDEARYVLDAVEYFDAREAARWRRQQELIAEYGAAHR